jgi:AI-2 transport protein TqsA
MAQNRQVRREAALPASHDAAGRTQAVRPKTEAGTWFLGILMVLVAGWSLRQTALFTMPLTMGFFVALAVWPVCRWVQEHVPRALSWLGYLAALLTILALLAVLAAGVGFVVQRLASDYAQQIGNVQQLWQEARSWLESRGLPAPELSFSQGDLASALGAARGALLGVLNSVWHALTVIVLALFVVMLMLPEVPEWRAELSDNAGDRAAAWREVVATVGQKVRRFLAVRAALGVVTGFLYGLWSWLFGVEHALLWGMLAFLLNFLPTIGSLIAGILPVLFAFAQHDMTTGIAVGAGILAIEQVMGNYVDPRLSGSQLSLSPLVVLVSLLLWSWIWGLAGALLAVPMAILLMTVMSRIPALEPIALFMSNRRNRRELRRSIRPAR